MNEAPNVLTLDESDDGWTQHLEGQAKFATWKQHKNPCKEYKNWNVLGHEAHVFQTSELEFLALLQCTEIRGNLLSTPVRQCTGRATDCQWDRIFVGNVKHLDTSIDVQIQGD